MHMLKYVAGVVAIVAATLAVGVAIAYFSIWFLIYVVYS